MPDTWTQIKGHKDNPGMWTASQMIEAAIRAAEAGEWAEAAACAQIASSLVFAQDAQAVADQTIQEALVQVERTTAGAMVAVERLAEVQRVLEAAKRTGPRHPAIHQALDIIRGTEAPEGEPRQPG